MGRGWLFRTRPPGRLRDGGVGGCAGKTGGMEKTKNLFLRADWITKVREAVTARRWRRMSDGSVYGSSRGKSTGGLS